MPDLASPDPVRALQRRLLEGIPALQPWLDAAREEREEEPTSEYWLFNAVVRPYLEALDRSGAEDELAAAWAVLEDIAAAGPDAARNHLFFVAEEGLDLWRFDRYLGPALRAHWILALTSYPTVWVTGPMNTHVDERAHRRRWLEEIDRIGGFAHLTMDEQNRIGGQLMEEFRIERITSEMLYAAIYRSEGPHANTEGSDAP